MEMNLHLALMQREMLPLSFADPRPECHHPEGRCGPAQAHTAESASVCTVKKIYNSKIMSLLIE